MKKAILSIGLFTLVLASTSFAAPTSSTSSIADNTAITNVDGTGAQQTGDHRKVDFNQNLLVNQVTAVDGTGAQQTGDHRKVD
ncbi:hypothetical protein [Flavobacterium aquicola]|uniref:Uncharacterized protein n=1 Tax=Flavobacterium aquicola TaxID=1682742 RepID=A0A3E0E3W2_9FLAO|nr:hypothetical protein [Flavobacterium aquicola]REG92972.1 hypothetical protein C8P67_11471 [Flavobacterium aquicola]